jgi:hypothetical protein
MLLALQFFSINDLFLVPACFVIMYAILRSRANAYPDPDIRKYYYRAFYFKTGCVMAFALVTEFYFGGGDTGLYFQVVKDLRAALSDDFGYFVDIVTTTKLDEHSPLASYIMYDNSVTVVSYDYMKGPNNFFLPRLALIPSLLFLNSYLCICLCFAMFALGGALRLFKTFVHYYPTAKKEIALATLFLPGVGFWSAGLLKDTICFGAVGFIIYGILNIFIKKQKIGVSVFWIVVSSYLLFSIKTYIVLVLLLAIVVWVFAETNKLIKDKTLRQVFALLTFVVPWCRYFMLQYFTSSETLQQYQLDNLLTSVERQRASYQAINLYQPEVQRSYYSINASNPASLALNSIVATFYRPFPWEIRSAAAVLSGTESIAFIFFTANLFFMRGISKPLRFAFRDPRLLFCFIFSLVFAIGVGASTANFGTLSRYKIPCIPFYLIMVFILYRYTNLRYPGWMIWILRFIK